MAIGALLVSLLLLSAGLVGYGAYRIHQLRVDRTYGRLLAVDRGGRDAAPLRSESWRIVGRPDEIRVLPDGRWVPVEWKSRSAPARGPPNSHRLQVLAYCLLCEASTGRPPPFGVLRYGDDVEFRVPWDRAAREELRQVRGAMARPYEGQADPSHGKCRACRWREVCPARAP